MSATNSRGFYGTPFHSTAGYITTDDSYTIGTPQQPSVGSTSPDHINARLIDQDNRIASLTSDVLKMQQKNQELIDMIEYLKDVINEEFRSKV